MRTIFLVAGIMTMNPANAGEQLRIFEMGESSQIVSFPVTAEEIADEDAKIGRLKALHDSKASKVGGEVITFELAESGKAIAFPVEVVEIMIEAVAAPIMETEAHAEKYSNF